MKTENQELSKTKQVASKTIYAAFTILKQEGGQLPGKEVIERIRNAVEFTDWEKEIYEKTGNVRWESIFLFYTVDSIKAGFLRKNKGIWYLTEEGEKAIKLGPVKLLETASEAYWKWSADNKARKQEVDKEELEIDVKEEQLQRANLYQLEEQATSGIKDFINKKNPYEFQDMVAALLKAMDYHIPYVSPKGKDGGLDIVAFRDPLGALEPRIKIQVKHRPSSAIPVDDIRSLMGLLNKDGDIGLFVTSGRFTPDAEKTARTSHVHVHLIDINTFIELWQKNYVKLSDEEKNMLPLQAIYFLGSND